MTEPKQIDNWQVAYVYLDASLTATASILRGFIDGRFMKSDALLWLDLEKRVAMTEKEIYKMGEPHGRWIQSFLSAGGCLEDIEIKDTTH
jgi:hypothetical protein